MTTRAELEAMFLTPEKFYMEIDALVWKEDISYIEATMRVCDEKEIDIEDLVKLKLICQNLRDMLYEDGVELGCLRKESKLPI